ncbi:MAG: CapA family protein [bacterium]|nr:CapA family protein [bacterium]
MKNIESQDTNHSARGAANLITLFLCGDVMIGRGIDQVMPHPSDPILYEPYMRDARGYVEIAEEANGPIPQPISFSYIWGDALAEWERTKPDVKIINLETTITKSGDYWQGKDIHYRMNPGNIPCLTAAGIDCCALANNHILDWGYHGLTETLRTLKKAKVHGVGVGKNLKEAQSPAVMKVRSKGRVVVFSFGSPDSGIPLSWAASEDKPGLWLLRELSKETILDIQENIQQVKQPKDITIASIHWGGNWGYEISREQREFAHRLIDEAGVDIIHGHSSHHVKGIEVYQDKLIIYGCGNFLDDYEGIGGHEHFRSDLGLMFFPRLDPLTGKLVSLSMIPTQIKNFRVNLASEADARWLSEVLTREGQKLGTEIEVGRDNTLSLRWSKPSRL